MSFKPLIAIWLTLFLLGCSRVDRGVHSLSTLYRVEIYCNGSITKAIKPLQPGIELFLHCFASGVNPQYHREWPALPTIFKVDSCGLITANGGSQLFLPKGLYDLYLISTNQESFKEECEQGRYWATNGKDYILATSTALSIENDCALNLIFFHLSTTIELHFIKGWSDCSNTQIDVALTLPASPRPLELSLGQITPAASLEEHFTKLSGSDGCYSTIILPLERGLSPTLKVKIKDSLARVLLHKELSLPCPTSHFLAGRKYLYNIEATPQSVTFLDTVVEDWIIESTAPVILKEL